MKTLILRPSAIYAFAKAFHWLLLAVLFGALAWLMLPAFILISVLFAGFGFCRFLWLRSVCYQLGEDVLQVRSGIIFRRTDYLELFRVKDYVVTQNLLMPVFSLMNVELLTTDLTGAVVLRGIPKSDIAEVIRERVQRARQNSQILELN